MAYSKFLSKSSSKEKSCKIEIENFDFKLKIIFRNFQKIILQKNCFDENWIAKNNSWKTNALAIEFARRTSDWTRKNENVVCTRCGLIFPSPRRETALCLQHWRKCAQRKSITCVISCISRNDHTCKVNWRKNKGIFLCAIDKYVSLSFSLSLFLLHNT